MLINLNGVIICTATLKMNSNPACTLTILKSLTNKSKNSVGDVGMTSLLLVCYLILFY